MPSFGKNSLERKKTLHSKLQKVLDEAIKHVDFSILEGVRTKERQAELVKQGLSKTMNSKHIPPVLPETHSEYGKSRAVDVAPSPIDFKDKDRFIILGNFLVGLAQGMGIKLIWGGDWNRNFDIKDTTFVDMPHLELDKDE